MADLPPVTPPGTDLVAALNAIRGGFEIAMGLVFTHISPDEVVGEVPVGPHLTQPYGLVHGGVYASMIETLASVGAAIHAVAHGRTSVGVENSTAFVRAVREGTLVGRATPVHRGRATQVWQVEIRDGSDRVVATGRVRTMSLEPGASLAGATVKVPS